MPGPVRLSTVLSGPGFPGRSLPFAGRAGSVLLAGLALALSGVEPGIGEPALLVMSQAVAAPSAAEEVEQRLRELEKRRQAEKARLEKAEQEREELARQEKALREMSIKVASRVQEQESALTALEEQLIALEKTALQKSAELSQQDQHLVTLLGALERVARQPPYAMLGPDRSAEDTVRTAMLLRVAIPGIEQRAEALRGELAALASLREEITEKRRAAEKTREELENEKVRMADLVISKADLLRQTEEQRAALTSRIAELGKEAGDVRDLIDRLEEQRRAEERALERERERERRQREQEIALARQSGDLVPIPEPAPIPPDPPARNARSATVSLTLADLDSFPRQRKAVLGMPVSGRIVIQYGDKVDSGAKSQGIKIETRQNAQIVAPFDGTVAYAGPFRHYGSLLIIEHKGGYHTLLAGMSRIDTVAGSLLKAGEPVGVMGKDSPIGGPLLYLELRRNGTPINPQPWLAMRDGKVTG